MCDSGSISEGRNAARNAENEGQSSELSVGNKDLTGVWITVRVCYTFAEHLSTFCSRPEIS